VVLILFLLLPPSLFLSTSPRTILMTPATRKESRFVRMQGRRHLAAIVASPKVVSRVSSFVKCSSSPFPS
jgi:hypothetical protein